MVSIDPLCCVTQEVTLDDRVSCSYMESGSCLHDVPELGQVRARCMGLTSCRIAVAISYLQACRTDSNFVQVEYECVPGTYADVARVQYECVPGAYAYVVQVLYECVPCTYADVTQV